MIYILVDESNKVCKIGYSVNPFKRFSELKVGNPNNLVIAGIIPGTEKQEGELHKRFAEFYRRGEWFFYSDEIKQFFNCGDGLSLFGYNIYPKFTSTLMSFTAVTDFKLLVYILGYSESNNPKLTFRYSNLQDAGLYTNTGYRQCQSSFMSLIKKGVILKPNKGEYYVNPEMLFRGDNYNRLQYLMSFYKKGLLDDKGERINFITDELKEQKFLSLNPNAEQLVISEKLK